MPREPFARDLQAASLAGRRARVDGVDFSQNPHLRSGPARDPELARRWEAGWLGADLELAQGASKEDVLSCIFLPRPPAP